MKTFFSSCSFAFDVALWRRSDTYAMLPNREQNSTAMSSSTKAELLCVIFVPKRANKKTKKICPIITMQYYMQHTHGNERRTK